MGEDYRGTHQAPDDGAPLHDLTVGGVFPDDVYTDPQLYVHDREHDPHGAALVLRVRHRPDAIVAIYRAVPPGVTSINTGDWVAIHPAYARQHGMHATDPALDWPVLHAEVPAALVINDGNSLSEWAYVGPSLSCDLLA